MMSNYTTHFNHVLSRPEFLPLPLPKYRGGHLAGHHPKLLQLETPLATPPYPQGFLLALALTCPSADCFLFRGANSAAPAMAIDAKLWAQHINRVERNYSDCVLALHPRRQSPYHLTRRNWQTGQYVSSPHVCLLCIVTLGCAGV